MFTSARFALGGEKGSSKYLKRCRICRQLGPSIPISIVGLDRRKDASQPALGIGIDHVLEPSYAKIETSSIAFTDLRRTAL
jgi:hypothetical protein